MKSILKKISAAAAALALVTVSFVSTQPALAEEVSIPKAPWAVCDDFITDFCIEEVSVQKLGSKGVLKLSYIRSGSEQPFAAAPTAPADPATPSNSATASDVANSQSAVAPVPATALVESIPGNAVRGIWTHELWKEYGLDAFGYEGLSVDLKAANQFSNDIFFTIHPAKFYEANATAIAARTDGSKLAINLDQDVKITLKVRSNAVKAGVAIGVANNLVKTSTPGTEENPGTIVMSGTPVPVPQITTSRQCEGETGVATAVVTTMQGFIETGAFGVDGLSGRMAVASNGVSCGASTPVWDDTTQTLVWTAGAPHFAPDGVTPNLGFYKAIIPANDALLLWGLTDPRQAVSALQVQVISEEGGNARVSSRNISYLQGDIIVEVTGFEFSKPKIQIKKVASFKGFAKKRDLVCVDPLTKKKVSFKDAYGCPKAPEQPVQNFVTTSFAKTTSSLNATQQKLVRGYLSGFIEATQFICTGVHRPNASASEKLLAKKRATAVCNYAKSRDKTLSYFAEAKPSAATNYQNKVLVTMKNER